MTKKATRKARTSATASTTKAAPAKAIPADVALLQALNGLQIGFLNASLFRRLAKDRARARAMHQNILNIRASIASDRASELARAGATCEQQLAALAEGMGPLDDPPRFNEPPDYIERLRVDVLAASRESCGQARSALLAGGAKGLDGATRANAAGQPRSIELRVKLMEAERVIDGLEAGLRDPQFIIDRDAASMEELGKWFGRACDEMHAVLESAPPDQDVYRPASWFGNKKMSGRLRMAAGKDRKTMRVRTKEIDGVVCYCVADARQWWPSDIPKEP